MFALHKRTDAAEGNSVHAPRRLASAITWKASKQTYYTVRLLVDRDRVADAYRAYAYFRWVDDQIDDGGMTPAECMAFVERQSDLVERLYRGEDVSGLSREERLLASLITGDHQPDSGLQSYICHMMAVMAFDAERRGRTITQTELDHYTRWLAIAVTEALHYFIGSRCGSPINEMRYLAATGAHITHMLRDTFDDLENDYINVPGEVLAAADIEARHVNTPAYRAWVMRRVSLAREYFRAGRRYLEKVESRRCRLAGYAYIARFEAVLDAIERDGYGLRPDYSETKTLSAGLEMIRDTLWETFHRPQPHPQPLARRIPVPES